MKFKNLESHKESQQFEAEIDLDLIRKNAISVKGYSYKNVLRFLEIYQGSNSVSSSVCSNLQIPNPELIKTFFLPTVPGVTQGIGKDLHLPPFTWNDINPHNLALNFTYNTNAFYRIFKNLSDQGRIPATRIDPLVDQACIVLSEIYKSNNHNIIRGINNNINMFMVTRIVEFLLGKSVFDADQQEPTITRQSLRLALEMAKEHASLPLVQKMGLALGKGIAFVEKYVGKNTISRDNESEIIETSYRYCEKNVVIDDRRKFLDRIYQDNETGTNTTLCAILDDTAESVDNLLWIQHLLMECRRLKVVLIANTAQVSINFSAAMVEDVLSHKSFSFLGSLFNNRFFVENIYCPLISFQPEFMTASTKRVIAAADIVYIKGMNFFETCQFKDLDTYYAFVVYGTVSQTYTGLNNFEGVFAHVPTGKTGYVHSEKRERILTLRSMHNTLL